MYIIFHLQNWHKEINKWLNGRVSVLAIDSGSKEDIDRNLSEFIFECG